MKALYLSLAVVLLGSGISPRAVAEPTPGEPHSGHVDKLRAEYERRRAEALQPVDAWYKKQLQVLEGKFPGERQAVDVEKVLAGETAAQDSQPQLKTALLAKGWIWRSERDANGVPLTFLPDGTVHHINLNGRWKITAPNEVLIEPSDTERYVLHFDSGLRTFVGNRGGVTGERK